MTQTMKLLKVNCAYIARIDIIDGDECEGVFLKWEFSRQQTTPTFLINENDNA